MFCKSVFRLACPCLLLSFFVFVDASGSENSDKHISGHGLININGVIQRVIRIDPKDDSCTPVRWEFRDCAEACETNPLGCAEDILHHVEGDGFLSRRRLNPGTTAEKPNIQSPMHGLFVPVWNNPQLNDAIHRAIKNPFAPIDMPDWSISAKLNNSPGVTNNPNPKGLDWATVMYKISGYCPERIFPDTDAPCKGGEWFWFLYRDGFLSFDLDPSMETSIPAWGKAEDFCLDCHGAVSDADWLWITHDLVKRQQELSMPLSEDGHMPTKTGAAFCDQVTALSPERPADVLFDPSALGSAELANRMFNCYSWKTFVALFWPAEEGKRGVADKTKSISGDGARVWETYKQTYEVFQPSDPEWTLEGRGWNHPQPLPQVCLDVLKEGGISPAEALTYQVLNETHQAFGSQFNNLVDQNGNIVHYNVRFTRDEFEFVKGNGYANTGGYNYNGPLGINKRLFRFPDNTNGVTGEGATEVKSAWKILCTDAETCHPLDDPSRYFSRKVLLYTPAQTKTLKPFVKRGPLPRPSVATKATCEVAEVGLVGFHIAAKTFWAPQWIWPTFEHIDNVPGNTGADEPEPFQFSFFDPDCGDITLEMCLQERPGITPQSYAMNTLLDCCPNQMNIVNSKPDPGNTGDLFPLFPPKLIAMQVNRIVPIPDSGDQASVSELNKLFRGLLAEAESPLQNYVMVNSQWPLNGRVETEEDRYVINNALCLDGATPAHQCVTFLPEGMRLRNTTIETYDMAYCRPDNQDIGNDPADCTPGSVGEDPNQFSSGGCMNCHFSSGTDSSFIWADGIEEQIPLK